MWNTLYFVSRVSTDCNIRLDHSSMTWNTLFVPYYNLPKNAHNHAFYTICRPCHHNLSFFLLLYHMLLSNGINQHHLLYILHNSYYTLVPSFRRH